jgi:hypothetical protein
MKQILSHLALQGWYNIDSGTDFNWLSATDKWQPTPRAHLLHLQTIQEDSIIRTVSQQVYHLRETHIPRLCRSIKLASLRDALEYFGISTFG